MQNNFKKYLIITLLTITFLPTFVFAAWWNPFSWNIWQKIGYIFNKQETTQVQQEKKLEEVKVDQINNWKTYTNTEYGFEIKYPINFKELSSPYPEQLLTANLNPVGLNCHFMDKVKSDDIFAKQGSASTHDIISEKLTFYSNGKMGYKYRDWYSFQGAFEESYNILFDYKTGSVICSVLKIVGGNELVSIETQESISKTKKLFSENEKIIANQILSTFKFTK